MTAWLKNFTHMAPYPPHTALAGERPGALVIVADDEQLTRLIIAEALVDAGYSVVEANDVTDVMSCLRARDDVRALVTDIHMSSSDGLAMAHRVHQRFPTIGIVLISGVFEPSEGALPSGSRFLLKPCRIKRLVESVRDVVERKRCQP